MPVQEIFPSGVPVANVKVGDTIYYGGDRANAEGIGRITKDHGDTWEIEMADGRRFPRVFKIQIKATYDGTGRTSFATKKAYDLWRDRQLAQLAKAARRTTTRRIRR